jgi:heavy metal sensor kinase
VNTRSISFRLVVWYAGLLTAIFALLCALLYLDLRRFLENDLRRAQLRRTHQVANTLLDRVGQTGEPAVAAATRDWYEPEINDRFIRITRADGATVYASGAPRDGSFDPRDVPAPVAPRAAESTRKLRLPGGGALIIAALKFQPPGGPGYLVEFGESLGPVETMLNHLLLQLALGLPLAVLIIAGGGYLLLHRALTPVEQITRAAERITQHNLSDRLPVARTGDELERLSLALNRMITRLDDAFQNSRRFVADASHDLRTPLTILRGDLENFAADARLEAEPRARVGELLAEVVHLSKIVEQLFTLSRLDAGEAQTEWSRFDFAELARGTTEQMNLLAVDRGVSLAFAADSPAPVNGNRVRLKQVVVNLVDNAIKYTPAGGWIHLRVRMVGDRVALEVEDSGIGIPPGSVPHVFERFYRVDPVRSADSESAGIGLSIVKAICSAHGAEVEVQSTLGRGSLFRVWLPLARN